VLWWVMLVGATVIFLLVMALVALAFRPGGAPAADPDGRYERVWIHGMGIGFAVAILTALLAYGLVIGERLLPQQGPDVVAVGAEGRQWDWGFTYADAPERRTEGVLHIPAGRPVDVAVTAADVIHSFWVPRLAGKVDAIPGHVNVLRIEAREPGEYAGVSSEFNGTGYKDHRFVVVAHDPESWVAFLAAGAP
jgi:heme/copper-type cytochrome/quinol oxidase subunit 2